MRYRLLAQLEFDPERKMVRQLGPGLAAQAAYFARLQIAHVHPIKTKHWTPRMPGERLAATQMGERVHKAQLLGNHPINTTVPIVEIAGQNHWLIGLAVMLDNFPKTTRL